VYRKKILIVDDSRAFLKALSLKISAQGYVVATAEDGARALTAVREDPDLILLDINFAPEVAQGGGVGWDGFRLMDWLRRFEETKDIPVIIVTGGDPIKSFERSSASGAAGFVHKSADPEEFLRVIRATIGESTEGDPAQAPKLRVLLYNTEKAAYFFTETRWTKTMEKAFDFGNDKNAIQVAQKLKLKKVELVFISEEGEGDVRLPLPDPSTP
jgi:CheY-like chemotaxis protein